MLEEKEEARRCPTIEKSSVENDFVVAAVVADSPTPVEQHRLLHSDEPQWEVRVLAYCTIWILWDDE